MATVGNVLLSVYAHYGLKFNSADANYIDFLSKDFRAVFKFGRRVHFALRRKMLKSPIARLPAILLYFINRPRGETDCIYEATIK